MSAAIAYLGLGANLGDRAETLRGAVCALAAVDGIEVLAVSHLYETPPWGKTDQPAFINGAVKIATTKKPEALLDVCLSVEHAFGRVRHEHWGARTLDVDLLFFEDDGACVTCDTSRLTLPHPYLTVRAFVLVPLYDIAPSLIVAGRTVSDWRMMAEGRAEIVPLAASLWDEL